MEDVRFYDFDFNLLHIEHDIFSCNWTLYENDIGRFEMHFPLESPLVSVMMDNRYMVAVQGDKQAIITGRSLGDEAVLYGRSCNWILTRFCIPEAIDTEVLAENGEIPDCSAQTVCAYLVGKVLGDLIVVETNEEKEFGPVSLKNQSMSTVFEAVQSSMEQAGGGHRIFFDVDRKQWVFIATKGQTLTAVFSEENKNAFDMAYTEDLQDYASGGWYTQKMEDMGNWNAGENSPKLVNNNAENFAKGYYVSVAGAKFGITFGKGDYIVCKDQSGAWEKAEKIEDFVVEIPPKMTGMYGWMAALDGETETDARKDLATKDVQRDITSKMHGFRLGQDYDLGDLVWVEIKKGPYRRSQIKKITGVRLWYEQNDIGEEPIMEEAEE